MALGLVAALPFLRGIDNSFIGLDDPEYVTENVRVLQGLTWEGVGWAMTSFHSSNWHPLTWLSHMADVSLSGVDPRWHHLVNVLLHSLNAALLFIALARLTASPGPSAFVAALFGVHPLRVESVAWVAERKDLLAGLFFMLILLAYERYARRGKAVRLLAVVLLLALGLTAKPMLVTVPFVLLLLDLWPLGRTSWAAPANGGVWAPEPWRRLLLEKAPLVALSLASSVVTYLAQRESGAIVNIATVPPGMRLANAVVSYTVYLGKTLWPSGLAVLYPHPPLGHAVWKILGSILLLAALSWAALSRFRHAPVLTVGWLWFVGMLVPVIGIVQVGSQAMADRYTYLPLVGVFIAIAWGLPLGLPGGGKRALVPGACAAVALLSVASWVQVGYWKDSEALFGRTLSLTTGNWLIENNLGTALEKQGRPDEAMEHYRKALLIRPDYPRVHNNLGSALINQGKLDEAQVHIREALRLWPDFPEAHFGLGNAFFRDGKYDAAIVEYREAIRLRPNYPEPHNNLGNALDSRGRPDEAVAEFREAIRLSPGFALAHNNLGNFLVRQGKPGEAQIHLREALRLRPDFPEAHYNLGNALFREGKLGEAIVQYRETLRLRPEYPEAHGNLASALFREGKLDEATVHYREALRLQPGLVVAHEGLAALLTQLGRTEEARLHFEEAGRLRREAGSR